MTSLYEEPITTMAEGREDFLKKLGQRVAELRKAQGLTQLQLAELLRLSQQQVASYENGTKRIPINRVHSLAAMLGISVEELLGSYNGTSKRGPMPRFQRQLEQISHLPRTKQRFLTDMLDAFLEKEKLKQTG